MEYWGVDDLYLEPCCVQRYYQQRELLNWDHQVKKEVDDDEFREELIAINNQLKGKFTHESRP